MNRARVGLLIAFCAMSVDVLAGAHPIDAAVVASRLGAVDDFVSAEMKRQKAPGVAIAIVSGGQVVAAKGYGLANVELQTPVTAASIFQSGSVGKQFTAAAVMLLVEDGKLALDEPITRYLADAPATWRKITVRNLLTHTSGIPNYVERDGGDCRDGRSIDYRRDYSDEELAKIAYAMPLQFAAGSRWSYSNTGYVLLGILVRKVSGQFYGDVLRERVFAPLGMKTARVISESDVVPNRSAGYRLDAGVLKNQEWISPTLDSTADGSLYLSILDFVAWEQGLRAGAILKPGSWAQIYAPFKLNSGKRYPYGFGWTVEEWRGKPWYHHGGAWQGFKSYISRYLSEDLTVVVLVNLAQARPELFVDGIVRSIDPEWAQIDPVTPIQDINPGVAKRVRTILETAAQGKLSAADLPFAREDIEAEAKAYQNALHPLGPLQKLDLVARRTLGDDESYSYLARYAEQTLRVQVKVMTDGRLADMGVDWE